MQYNFNTNSYIEFGTALAAFLTILLLWKNRKSSEVKYLIYFEFFVSLWAISYAMEFGTNVLETKVLWSQLSYFGIAFLPLLYFLFTTAFSQKTKIITQRNILILLIIPLITLVLALTNNKHHLIWTDVKLDEHLNIAYYYHGIWFWIFYVYTQIMILFGLYNLVSSIYKFTAYYKSHISTLLIASIIPIIANFLYISRLNPFPGFDWTPVSFVLTGLIIAFGIGRYKMFDLVPFARNKLIDTLDDGILVLNAGGFIEDCNPAFLKIFGLEKKAIIKNSALKVFAKFENFIEGLKQNNAEIFPFEIQNKNETKYFQVRNSLIYNGKNEISGRLLLLNDITSIRKTEIELTKTNKQLLTEIENREKLIDDLDSFAHTVAHDLKNSLGSIYSSSEVLTECIENNKMEFLTDLSELIKDSSYKAIQITNELLILATTGHQDVVKSPLKMADIIKDAKFQLQYLIQEYDAKITSEENWPAAFGHGPWIEEVWKNLMSNAIKYGGNPPEISLGSKVLSNNKVKFWIKDNGDGIDVGAQNKLFKKYTRLNPKKAKGYGLGLSIVKRIVEKLDGTVGVESSGKKGEGALFFFILNTTE